jgi:hypothetical protein
LILPVNQSGLIRWSGFDAVWRRRLGVIMSEIIVDIDEARRDLAAIFRWTARESMHEGIANHFSYAISDDGQQFLMNPYGVHFSKMRASDLLLLDARKTPSDYGQKG